MSDAPDTPRGAPTPEAEPSRPKVRLLDVTVEPRFAVDDGDHLRPLHRDELAQLGVPSSRLSPAANGPPTAPSASHVRSVNGKSESTTIRACWQQ